MIACAFCDEPADRVCSWPVKKDWLGNVIKRCDKPVCYRHLREPGECVYCADHWGDDGQILPYVPEYLARQADADPDRFNRPKRKRSFV
jgi:hypothetical protein